MFDALASLLDLLGDSDLALLFGLEQLDLPLLTQATFSKVSKVSAQ
jgi:hypothetical protein